MVLVTKKGDAKGAGWLAPGVEEQSRCAVRAKIPGEVRR